MKNDGGPAFPCSKCGATVVIAKVSLRRRKAGSMSVIRSQCKDDDEYLKALRDDFAAAALQGIASRFPYAADIATQAIPLAEDAYEIADAMLKEREKP